MTFDRVEANRDPAVHERMQRCSRVIPRRKTLTAWLNREIGS